MSLFHYESGEHNGLLGVADLMVTFDPEDGELFVMDYESAARVTIPKGEAINLASKLLQWGTQK